MNEVPVEIDWTPEGITVIYGCETEWWADSRRKIREAMAKER